ncbi:MAG: peptidylprolyl isomerase [Nitrospinota bacterium]|nr:peptidylprolyl isomerase [Nitrospinota bacterium]
MTRLKLYGVGFLLLALLLPAATLAEPFKINGQPIPEKVASVNGVELDSQLLISEIKVYRLMNRQKNKELSEQELADFSHQALARLVDQELIYQEAHKKNIQIDSELLNKRLEEIRSQFPSEDMFHMALDMQGLTLDLLKTKFQKQMMEENIIRQEVAPHVKVDDPEVAAFYQKSLDQLRTPEKYEAHHIFTSALQEGPHGSEIEDEALRKKAERLNALLDQDAAEKIKDLYRQLQDGADFSELAKEHSEDTTTGKNGGSWGAIPLSELPEAMAQELKKLKQNEFSEPVRSPYGYHILKWTKIIPAGHIPLDEIKSDIMNMLLRDKTLEAHQKMISQMREQAEIKLYY